MIEEYIEKYNDLGWVIMPIKANEKRPFIKNWSKITSNDETLDKFKEDSNLGVLMGKVSGIICIDVDVKNVDGVSTLKSLEEKYGPLPSTVTSETPSGGIHYYFKYFDGIHNRKNIGEGIDVQADGTQTLEEPSVVDGNPYEWVYDPFEYEIEELPENWKKMLSDHEDDIQLTAPPFEAPKVIKEGSRNNTIAQYVGSLLGKKLKKDTVIRKTLKYNEEACNPPLDEDEVKTIIDSMIKTDVRNKTQSVFEAVLEDREREEGMIDFPWLYFDETGSPGINERVFADWYVKLNEIHCVNKRFFTKYGLKSDGWFENDIQNIIGGIVTTKLAAKVSDLIKVVKTHCYMEVKNPDPFKIQFDNASFDVSTGKLVPCKEFFTLHQIPHDYDANADCPIWKAFLNELFYEEDIPVVQQYLGYCLVPNTLAQTALFITGEGGEGKSRITVMMEHIMGENSVVIGDFNGLQDRFSLSSLDNQMLFIDDDISLDALDDTSNFKKIVTAETSLEVESKGVPKYKTHLYSRIIGVGNGAVSSKFDHSDGFYRRLLVCKVKSLRPDRKTDRRLSEKMKTETAGIINWLLEGLLTVVNNGFIITPSRRMMAQVQDIRENADTIAQFFNDDQYLEYTFHDEDAVSTKDLYAAYEIWCNDNAQLCLSKSTFSKRSKIAFRSAVSVRANATVDIDKLTSKERMYIDGKQVRGFCGVRIKNFNKSFTVKG